jgi:hypothetical protein
MAQTRFTGPVLSDNGFVGDVVAETLTTTSDVIMLDLPTSDPEVLGQLWNDSGVLTVSAGPTP